MSRDGARATTVSTIRIRRWLTAPALARRHVEHALEARLPPSCVSEITLLTSELVTNVVEYSHTGPIEVAVKKAPGSTRVDVTGPPGVDGCRPEMQAGGVDEVGGRGLFLVEHLSDRWGIDEDGATVWFEFDHYETLRAPPRSAPSPR